MRVAVCVGVATNVWLRPLAEHDASAVQAYASDAQIAATTDVPHPYPSDGGMMFVRRALDDASSGVAFVFAVLGDGQFVGLVSIRRETNAEALVAVDFGIAVPFWNRGYGTAALQAAVRHARVELGAMVAQSVCLCENVGSRRVLEKNRFLQVGERFYDGLRLERFAGRTLAVYRRDLNA